MKGRKWLLFSLIMVLVLASPSFGQADKSEKINIIFTHDLHDHIEDFDVLEDGEIVNVGGFERLKKRIDEERKKDPELLVLDGGDYSMGTLFQTIYGEESPSLRLLGDMGYDAVTLGNHEFDFKAEGLTSSLQALKASGDSYPQLVASNIDFKDYEGVDQKEVEALEEAFRAVGGRSYTVVEKNGLRIGIFGLLGKEAISNAPMAGVNFQDPIKAAKASVRTLRTKEKVDMVIALSHSGTWEDEKKSEDEILAKKVKGIDLIISGHTHSRLDQPKMVGDTVIASSGRYTENVGSLEMAWVDGKWKLANYQVEPLRGEIGERELDEKINFFRDRVQESYLDRFGLDYDQVLGHTSFNFTPANEIGKVHGEDPLANLIADSFIHMVRKVEGADYKELAGAIVPAGTIRDSFTEGDIRVADVFKANSLGIGPDQISGYPLVEVYLTGEDLRTAAEVDASIAPLMPEAQLYMAGIGYSFNPNRLIFNKLTDVHLIKEDGSREELVDDQLYRVVAGLYTGQMLSVVKDQSKGLLSITPRTESGIEILDLEDHIIYDGEDEIKEWYAVADYISSFDKLRGIAELDKRYAKPEGRKTVDQRRSIKNKFMKPNSFAKKVYGGGLVLILLLLLIGRLVYIRLVKKLKKIN